MPECGREDLSGVSKSKFASRTTSGFFPARNAVRPRNYACSKRAGRRWSALRIMRETKKRVQMREWRRCSILLGWGAINGFDRRLESVAEQTKLCSILGSRENPWEDHYAADDRSEAGYFAQSNFGTCRVGSIESARRKQSDIRCHRGTNLHLHRQTQLEDRRYPKCKRARLHSKKYPAACLAGNFVHSRLIEPTLQSPL